MTEINASSHMDKSTDRISKNAEDRLMKEAYSDSLPTKFYGNPSLMAPIHSQKLLDGVHNALKHNDIKDAANKLRREVDFCDAIPKLSGSPYEKSGKAGLNALNKHKSATEIDQAMREAWDKAWQESPAPFYDFEN